MNPYILEAENLCYQYANGTKALQGVNMKIKRNGRSAILGSNGAGKSTLFLHFNGLLKPGSGKIQYAGKDFQYTNSYLKTLRRNVGIVFQNPDNQLFSASVRQDISFGLMNLGFSNKEAQLRIEQVGQQLGITDLFTKPTHFLSVGQKKMVALAGVLVMEPEILICDEPTAGLDPANAEVFMQALDLLYHKGTSIIISTHDVDLAYAWADDIYIMNQGQVTQEGKPEIVLANQPILDDAGLKRPWILEIWQHFLDQCPVLQHLPAPRNRQALLAQLQTRYFDS